MILLPRQTRASQPPGELRLDLQNPLTRDLAFVCSGQSGLFPESGRHVRSPAPLTVGQAGVGMTSLGDQTFGSYPGDDGSAWTAEVYGRWTTPTSQVTIIHFGANVSQGMRGIIAWGGNGFKNIYFLTFGGDADSGIAWDMSGAMQHVVVTGGNGKQTKFFVNGVLAATVAPVVMANLTNAEVRLNPYYFSFGSPTNFDLYKASYYRRTLSDAEAISLGNSPFQIFESPRSFVPVSVASSGGATHTNTGSLSADVATIAGTAVHKTLHATSGALASDAAVIAGVASSVTNRPSSGALASDSATIAGTAAHKALHATSGALASDAATIAGSAAKTSAGSFASSGSLSAGDSAISGTATHKALHATSGALSADAATLSGAARIASHRTEGAIAAGPAIMAGVAVHSGRGAVVETQYSGGYVETLREKDARRKRQKRLSDEADNRRQEEQQKPVEPQEKPKKARRIEVDRRPEQQVSLRDQIAALPVDLDAIYAVQERERLAAEQAAIEAELLAAEQEQQEIMWIASQVQQMIYDAYQGSDRWKAISGKLLRLSQILARR